MEGELDTFGVAWRVGATLLFVFLNGFFVAAEFALVKVRQARIVDLSEQGIRSARVARHLLQHLDHYLSSCQLGITMASLALGALGEPAVARLIVAGAQGLGLSIPPNDPILHGVAFVIAFATITTLHMTIGEQAPKMWAIRRSESMALRTSYALWAFSYLFTPVIAFVNRISNWLLRLIGLPLGALTEGSHTAEELRSLLSASAGEGHISRRQLEFADNVLRMMDLQVRHIQVPRTEITFVSLLQPPEENLRLLEESRHSRFPVCETDLDAIIGVLHAKDLTAKLRAGEPIDLRELAREAVYVSETQPLSRLIVELQDRRQHCAVVLDERGSCSGLVFLEDALEEIVGPIADEFDAEVEEFIEVAPGLFRVSGRLPLPEAAQRLDLDLGDAREDTIGGHIVTLLRRLPQPEDQLQLGPYRVTVEDVTRRMVNRLRIERADAEGAPGKASEGSPSG
jgi:CBS domain containing-hemolysin-like protein